MLQNVVNTQAYQYHKFLRSFEKCCATFACPEKTKSKDFKHSDCK